MNKYRPLILLAIIALGGCASDSGTTSTSSPLAPRPRSINVPTPLPDKFSEFKAASATPYVTSWSQTTYPNHIQGHLSNKWNNLSPRQKGQLLETLWRNWAIFNTPDEPQKSYLTLLYNGKEVAYARADTNGKWQQKIR